MNFDWINQINTNETNDDGNLFQSLHLDSTDSGQDIVKYLFDSTQFPTSLDSSTIPLETPPASNSSTSSNYTAGGDSPKSMTMATLNNSNNNSSSNLATMPTLDQTWLMTMDSQLPIAMTSINPTPPTTTTKATTTTSSRKLRIKQSREPIFVTEKPQNAYKKRAKRPPKTSNTTSTLHPISENEQQQQQQQQTHQQQQRDLSSSPSSPSEDDDDMDINDPSDKRRLSSKEKRQLRNKISARNFRVRRKEYINQLENLVDQQEDEINSLKKENKRLTNQNQQMVQELFQLKLQQQTATVSQPQQLPQQQQQQHQHVQQYHPPQPPMMISPPSSDTNSPPDIMDTLLDFGLFTNNTYLSHSLMPDFDLSAVLGDKLKTPPSSTHLENHRELMTMYPLLAPALASMVIRHTFTLHYATYLSNAFPYNTSTLQNKNELLDIMHLDDWVTAVSSSSSTTQHGGGGDDDPNKNGNLHLISSHAVVEQMTSSSSISVGNDKTNDGDDDTWSREFEKNILQQHYPYYAFMRLRGLSHDEVIRRCQASVQRRMTAERQRRKKAASSCSKWQALHGFSAVATTLLRNPSRSPMIASVIQDSKACQVSDTKPKTKVPLIMTAPLRALRIVGSKA